ncbi:MAG: hypothetical protein ACOH5I_10305 [Oligoflexus sp.]
MSDVMPSQVFQERLQKFTRQSLDWCSAESEASIARVTDAIEMLLQNTARVSELSEKSLKAIENLQTTLKKSFFSNKVIDLNQVIASLEHLAREHAEIQEIIQPIIRSLQFQDRLQQNLENMQKILAKWLEQRQQFQKQTTMTAEQLQSFGQSLMSETTMKSERDVIRKHILGLPPEEDVAPMTLF